MSEPLDLDKIRRLAGLMERRRLTKIVLTEDGVTVRLEAAAPVVATSPAEGVVAAPFPPVAPPEHHAPAAEPAAPEGVPLTCPTTGTFYRAPAPGESPFVDVGDVIEVGQTVGIIMAMKVMSEVPAEVAGEIVAIPAQDGQLIQSGDALIIVRPA